jgi:hypothetical protein
MVNWQEINNYSHYYGAKAGRWAWQFLRRKPYFQSD